MLAFKLTFAFNCYAILPISLHEGRLLFSLLDQQLRLTPGLSKASDFLSCNFMLRKMCIMIYLTHGIIFELKLLIDTRWVARILAPSSRSRYVCSNLGEKKRIVCSCLPLSLTCPVCNLPRLKFCATQNRSTVAVL